METGNNFFTERINASAHPSYHGASPGEKLHSKLFTVLYPSILFHLRAKNMSFSSFDAATNCEPMSENIFFGHPHKETNLWKVIEKASVE